jgi:hypothetical protein
LKQFLKFKTIEKHLNHWAQYWAETGPWLQPTGRGGLPHAGDQKSGWATAWQPSPAGKTACAAHGNARAPARLPRADRARDGVVARSPVAHQNGVLTVRRHKQRRVAAFNSGGVAPVVVDERGEVLQIEGDPGGEEPAVN